MAALAEALHVRAIEVASGRVPKALVRALLPHVLSTCAVRGSSRYCPEWEEWWAQTRGRPCVTMLSQGYQRPRPSRQKTRPTATPPSPEEKNDASSAVMTLLAILGATDNADAGYCCAL